MSFTRIVAIGGECTGKTTLVKQLSDAFSAPYSSEAVRDYVTQLGRTVKYSDVETIAKRQISSEDKLLASNSRIMFLDTDLFSTLVYSHYYFKRCPKWIEPLCNTRRADLYLLCGTDLPWITDKLQRGSGDYKNRQAIHLLFAEKLAKSGCNIVNISGRGVTRLNQAIRAVEKQSTIVAAS